MSTNTEELLRKLSDKIAEIYDLELAEELIEIFKVLVLRIKNTSKRYWSLVRKLAACEKERDMEREKVRILEEIHWEHVRELSELRGAPEQEPATGTSSSGTMEGEGGAEV